MYSIPFYRLHITRFKLKNNDKQKQTNDTIVVNSVVLLRARVKLQSGHLSRAEEALDFVLSGY